MQQQPFESNWHWVLCRVPFVVFFFTISMTTAVLARRSSPLLVTGTFRTSDLVVDNNASIGSDSTFGGRATFTSSSASTDGIVEINGASAGTTKQLFIKEVDTNHTAFEANNAVMFQQATFDTSAGLANAVGLDVETTSTRVAGANELTNYGLLVIASGADNNFSVFSPSGGGKINITDGAEFAGLVHTTASAQVDADLTANGNGNIKGAVTLGTGAGNPVTVNGAPTFNAAADFENNATFNGTALFDNPVRIGTSTSNRHVIVPTTAAAPTFSGCGSVPTIDGSDHVATVHTDNDASTTCTILFHSTYGAAPHCTVTSRDGLQITYATTATTLAVTNAGLANTTFDYTCVGPT